MGSDKVQFDHQVIFKVIDSGSKVLDLGCGDGELLYLLAKEKNAKVQGIELDEASIYKCVAKGLSVFHSDIDSGLIEYPDQSFDYVILNQSLQEVKRIEFVLKEALRVGKKAIVGFPNFAYFKARVDICFLGQAPVTKSLPHHWYDTPNVRFLSIKDFEHFCQIEKVRVLEKYFLGKNRLIPFLPNLFAMNAIFVISKD